MNLPPVLPPEAGINSRKMVSVKYDVPTACKWIGCMSDATRGGRCERHQVEVAA